MTQENYCKKLQNKDPMNGQIPEGPRTGKFADRPGCYSAVVKQLTLPIINKGDRISFQLFFTGYGEIKAAKIFLPIPTRIFDPAKSHAYSDIATHPQGGFRWGARKVEILGDAVTIALTGGIGHVTWKEGTTQFLDTNDDPKMRVISTEIVTDSNVGKDPGNAPLGFDLMTKSKIKAGQYSINIVFTYYNGTAWCSDSKVLEFKVQNFLEQYASIIGSIALIGSILGLIYALYPIAEFIYKWILECPA